MVAIAAVIDSIELDENTVLVLRFNPDFDWPYTVSEYDIESKLFKNTTRFISPLLAEEEFEKRIP